MENITLCVIFLFFLFVLTKHGEIVKLFLVPMRLKKQDRKRLATDILLCE